MSENLGGRLPGSIGDLPQRMLSQPSSPALRESGEASSTQHSYPRAEDYGLFTFGDKRPPGSYNIDIVAVHGLGGDWEGTWTDENGKLWLRDFLPSQLPDAKIMSYGYNSEVVFSKAATDISDEAAMLLDRLDGERQDEKTRPIIFIAHSLGGIVVKKALILAHERSLEYGDLLFCVRGCVFFGVPHRGAESAYWANFAANIIKIALFGRTNTDFVAALQQNSTTFADISQQFVERGAPLKIRTFYETEKLDNHLVVDRNSARLGLVNEVAVGIAGADHNTMCKFNDINSQKYLTVWRAIKRMSETSVTLLAPSSVPLSSEEKLCLQSLYMSDYDSHRGRVPSAVLGTCTWYLRHERFIEWGTEEQSSLLWVSADPGCGKSVLSSFLVERLRSAESQAALPGTVCFFFFKDDSEEQKTAVLALCALLHQLFKTNNSLIEHAMEEFESKGKRFVEDFHSLWKIFTGAAADSQAGNVICVIDALDECEKSTRSILVDSLVRFYSDHDAGKRTSASHLKIILTSRPYQSIEDSFHDLPRIRLRGEDETISVNADVKLFIAERVGKLGLRRNLPDRTQMNLLSSLVEGADRTFLWVSLILGILEETPVASEREFHDILSNLPQDLDAVYEKILGGSRDPNKAKKILHIIVAAARPLSLDEMNVALAIKAHHKSSKDLEPNLISSFGSAVKELCGLFVRVIDSKIYLVHQTAKEYLVDGPRTNGPSPGTWKHALNPVESNSVVANICVRYLLLTDFEINPLVVGSGFREMEEAVDLYTNRHTFLDYAAKHWAGHFREAQTKQDAELLESAVRLCSTTSKIFSTWLPVYWIAVRMSYRYPENCTNLMMASYLGHEVVVQLLLARGAKVNEYVVGWGGAVNMAALGKRHSTVQVLLDNGGKVYLFGKGYAKLHKVGGLCTLVS